MVLSFEAPALSTIGSETPRSWLSLVSGHVHVLLIERDRSMIPSTLKVPRYMFWYIVVLWGMLNIKSQKRSLRTRSLDIKRFFIYIYNIPDVPPPPIRPFVLRSFVAPRNFIVFNETKVFNQTKGQEAGLERETGLWDILYRNMFQSSSFRSHRTHV